MTNISTSFDAENVEDVEQVIYVGIESGVPSEVEVIRVDTAGADQVIKDDAVVRGKEGKNALPSRLVRAEPMSQNEDFVAGADDSDIKRLKQYVAHVFVLIEIGNFVVGRKKRAALVFIYPNTCTWVVAFVFVVGFLSDLFGI